MIFWANVGKYSSTMVRIWGYYIWQNRSAKHVIDGNFRSSQGQSGCEGFDSELPGLVNVYKKQCKDPPCYQWVNPLFLWPFSSSQTVTNYQRVYPEQSLLVIISHYWSLLTTMIITISIATWNYQRVRITHTHRIHGAGIYGNICHQYTPVMLAYIPYIP